MAKVLPFSLFALSIGGMCVSCVHHVSNTRKCHGICTPGVFVTYENSFANDLLLIGVLEKDSAGSKHSN